jgi:hypothetical protein
MKLLFPKQHQKPEFGHTRVRFEKKLQKSTLEHSKGGGGGVWGSESHKTIINFGGKLSFILSLLCPKRLPVQLL